eukprot:125114-Rhodomonas_salina.4
MGRAHLLDLHARRRYLVLGRRGGGDPAVDAGLEGGARGVVDHDAEALARLGLGRLLQLCETHNHKRTREMVHLTAVSCAVFGGGTVAGRASVELGVEERVEHDHRALLCAHHLPPRRRASRQLMRNATAHAQCISACAAKPAISEHQRCVGGRHRSDRLCGMCACVCVECVCVSSVCVVCVYHVCVCTSWWSVEAKP